MDMTGFNIGNYTGYIIIALVVVAVLWAVAVYNRLVRLSNLKDEGWSGIDVQLKRRFDLIPNIVETVKGYASHEQSTLQKVIEARSAISAVHSGDVGERANAENMLTSALRSIFALQEAYPDLKANVNFMDLQKQLSQMEETLQMARRYYNGTVRDLNNAVSVFPGNMIANTFGFKKAPFFETDDESRQAPKVSFNGNGSAAN